MTIGYYQNELRDLRGNALTSAVVDVFNAGTTTPALLFSNPEGTTPLTSSPLAASAGLLLPGKDAAANIAFFADDGNEYDVRVAHPSATFTFRARLPSGGAVAGAVSGIGVLDRTGAVVSGPFDALNDWRTALAAVRAGTANARMVAMGDSTIGGWPTSFVDRLVGQWAANRLSAARHGAIYTVNPATYAEARVVHGSGWTTAGVGDYGAAGRGVARGAVGAAGTLDIGPCEDCDRFEIWYFDAGVGSFDWWIDGGSPTTVSVGATAVVPSPSVITPSVTPGTHTLHIGNIVGNPVFIPFVEPRRGTSGLYVSRGGLGGTTSSMWNEAVQTSFSSSIIMFHTLQPDLTLIMLTAGDFNTQTALATYRDNIDDMVVLGKTYGSVVLAVSPRPTITAYDDFNSYNEYIAELESIRDARGVGLINFAHHFSHDDPDLYMADTLHPRVEAQGEMALVAASALMP